MVLRKTPLVPTDILGFNTAMSVAGNYKFRITSRLWLATTFGIFLVILIHKLPLWKNMIEKKKISEMIGFRLVVATIISYTLSTISFQTV